MATNRLVNLAGFCQFLEVIAGASTFRFQHDDQIAARQGLGVTSS